MSMEHQDAAAEPTTEQLSRLIESRQHVLQQIHQYTVRQRELIDANRVTALLELLTEKQHAVQQLGQLEAMLKPHREIDPGGRVWESETARTRCRTIQAESERLLAEILQLENESEQTLSAQRDHIAEELNASHSAGEACRAYQQNA